MRRAGIRREKTMNRQTLLLSAFAICIAAVPAFAAEGVPEMLNVHWGKNAFNFESMPTGAPALRNLSRLPNGKSNAGQLVGDYNNPILKPEAAAVVKAKGELAKSGRGFPNAQDQCRAIAPPFFSAMTLDFAFLPVKNGNIIISDRNSNMRYVRMNASHPAGLKPTPTGDSVGRWEGDTLVIDTVGMKVDKYTSIDRFGTPLSDQMHVVERYRLIDGSTAKAQTDAYETSEGTVGGGGRDAGYHPDTNLKGLELQLTMDDPKMLTGPWTNGSDCRAPSRWSSRQDHESSRRAAGALDRRRVCVGRHTDFPRQSFVLLRFVSVVRALDRQPLVGIDLFRDARGCVRGSARRAGRRLGRNLAERRVS
jgi:hypothetical protein